MQKNRLDATNPTVMSFSANDPTGGGGTSADIEALMSMGCHCAPIITTLTIQDTHDLKALYPTAPHHIVEQARAVLEDIDIQAFKLGTLATIETVEAIHSILHDYPKIPVIYYSNQPKNDFLTNDLELTHAIQTLIFPLSTIVTINSIYAKHLAPDGDTLDACAQQLLEYDCQYVLITGVNENAPTVINALYSNRRLLDRFSWQRLPYQYHGAGCTLSAALAGLLAQNLDPLSAVREAQEYTWESLKHAYRIGMGKHIPNRLYWAHNP